MRRRHDLPLTNAYLAGVGAAFLREEKKPPDLAAKQSWGVVSNAPWGQAAGHKEHTCRLARPEQATCATAGKQAQNSVRCIVARLPEPLTCTYHHRRYGVHHHHCKNSMVENRTVRHIGGTYHTRLRRTDEA